MTEKDFEENRIFIEKEAELVSRRTEVVMEVIKLVKQNDKMVVTWIVIQIVVVFDIYVRIVIDFVCDNILIVIYWNRIKVSENWAGNFVKV